MKERKSVIRERMQAAGRAHAAEQAQKAIERARDTAGNLMDDGQITPEEYASDQVKYSAEELGDYAVHAAGHDAKAAIQKGRDSVRRRAEKVKTNAGRGTSPAPSSTQDSVDGPAVCQRHGKSAVNRRAILSQRRAILTRCRAILS